MREDAFNSLNETTPDVLIIGAGINGIGTFRDLAMNGVNVVLVDRGDFCSGASAASSHMAHGGIRYLENGEFRLVREAVQERNRMIRNAPHLVRPLPTVIPIFRIFSGLLNAPLKFLDWLDRPAERGMLVIKIGLMLYDAYTRNQGTVPRHSIRSRPASLAAFPALNPDIRFTARYYDGQILSPERYAVELLLDGLAEGEHAQAFNYVRFDGMSGGAVRLLRESDGKTVYLRPRLIVNAAGPWIDAVNRGMGIEKQYIGGTKGSHLVLDHPELRRAIGDHEIFYENHDGRIVLIFPFYDKVIVGTSDIPVSDPDSVRCEPEEDEYFLGMIGRVFPQISVGLEHVIFRFSGVRPLGYADAKRAGQIARDHSLKIDRTGAFDLLSLVGGKWTSYRAFSEQASDVVLERLGRKRRADTRDLAIGGGRDYPPDQERRAVFLNNLSVYGIDGGRAVQLFERYGTRAVEVAAYMAAAPDAPLQSLLDWSRREVEFLAVRELALRLDDLILRRSSLAWLGLVTRPLLEELTVILGEAHGWGPELRSDEVARVVRLLAEQHGVQVR